MGARHADSMLCNRIEAAYLGALDTSLQMVSVSMREEWRCFGNVWGRLMCRLDLHHLSKTPGLRGLPLAQDLHLENKSLSAILHRWKAMV